MVETLRFLNVAIRIDSLRAGSADTRPSTAASGIIGSSLGDVRQISTDPEQDVLRATIRGQDAESIVRELEELAASSVLDSVPVVDSRGGSRRDGYYATTLVSAAETERLVKAAYEVELRLEKKGTLRSHWRQTVTDVAQLDHGFGTTTEAHLGIPANATKVQWHDAVGGSVQSLSSSDVIATLPGAHRDVDVVDVQDAPVADPSVIYELPYSEEAWADPSVWDTLGNDSKADANGNVVWSHVYAPQHDYDGLPILDNGLLRLEFDEPNGSIAASEWDDSAGSWSSISLSSGDWSLFDLDVAEIGQPQILAQLKFKHTDGALFTLDARMETGATDLLWSIPEGETGPIPSGLQSWLNPIASSRILSAKPERTVKARGELRKGSA